MMRQLPLLLFRAVLCAFSALAGVIGIWVLAATIIGPRASYFPTSVAEADASYATRNSAARAAEVGMIRGDLWTAAAITSAAPLLSPPTESVSKGTLTNAEMEAARKVAERAVMLSPHDSRNWLVLADLDSRLGRKGAQTAEFFKQSYYTGPNEFSLTPLRLSLAVQSDAMSDEELQNLVAAELQRIIIQRPVLKPVIAMAYKKSVSKGREVIETTLEQADPDFLATIR